MSQEVISSWLEKAKAPAGVSASQTGVKVVRREEPKSKGAIIMDLAEKLWPGLMKMFEGVRDNEGMLLQPAHIRGIALNVAQGLVNSHEDKK